MDKHVLRVRSKYVESELEKVSQRFGKDAAEAMRRYYSLYDEKIYIWFANLYDPETCGFYYSSSAKNTDGFLPDLESTRQAAGLFGAIGLMDDYEENYYNCLSEEEKQRLANWVKEMQSPDDGYFYHPQWGDNINHARRGRDLIWANMILKSLSDKPYYDTPDGVKGANERAVADCSSPTEIKESEGQKRELPEHLQRIDAWVAYIEAFDWDNNSYGAGNALQAQFTQIKAAGSEYIETLMNWLYDHQNSENGLWENDVSYKAVNGLMKIAALTNNLGYSVRNLRQALSSTLKMALTPDFTPRDEHVCSIYNVWVCMNIILKSASETERDELQKMINDKAAELIDVSCKKLSLFKKEDGGFSYFRQKSNEYSQGVRVAVPNCCESDVNATSICCSGARITMMQVLGLENIKLFTPEDGRYFVSLLKARK